jgi:hypothetical protein
MARIERVSDIHCLAFALDNPTTTAEIDECPFACGMYDYQRDWVPALQFLEARIKTTKMVIRAVSLNGLKAKEQQILARILSHENCTDIGTISLTPINDAPFHIDKFLTGLNVKAVTELYLKDFSVHGENLAKLITDSVVSITIRDIYFFNDSARFFGEAIANSKSLRKIPSCNSEQLFPFIKLNRYLEGVGIYSNWENAAQFMNGNMLQSAGISLPEKDETAMHIPTFFSQLSQNTTIQRLVISDYQFSPETPYGKIQGNTTLENLVVTATSSWMHELLAYDHRIKSLKVTLTDATDIFCDVIEKATTLESLEINYNSTQPINGAKLISALLKNSSIRAFKCSGRVTVDDSCNNAICKLFKESTSLQNFLFNGSISYDVIPYLAGNTSLKEVSLEFNENEETPVDQSSMEKFLRSPQVELVSFSGYLHELNIYTMLKFYVRSCITACFMITDYSTYYFTFLAKQNRSKCTFLFLG